MKKVNQQFARKEAACSRLWPLRHGWYTVSFHHQSGQCREPVSTSMSLIISRSTTSCFFPSSQFNSSVACKVQFSLSKRYKHKMIPSTSQPLAGFWKPTHLQGLYYGASSVEQHLLETLPTEKSKAFIVTGNSLATKTPLIKQVEELLGQRHAGTFSEIKQHSPIQQLDEILDKIFKDKSIDTVLSIGGGSPCDSSKAISHRHHLRKGRYLRHVTVPTTLSAAECTGSAGLTDETGLKTGIASPDIVPDVIMYDAKFAAETPSNLLMSTGFRALDHAMELMYHPTVSRNHSSPLSLLLPD